MKRSIVAWFRLVLPPTAALGGFLACYVVWGACYLGVVQVFGPAFATELLKVRDGLLLLAAASYGAFRVAAFHPLERPGY
jgi:hypothetical protein